jgi:hypothetical protein
MRGRLGSESLLLTAVPAVEAGLRLPVVEAREATFSSGISSMWSEGGPIVVPRDGGSWWKPSRAGERAVSGVVLYDIVDVRDISERR